MNYFVKYLLKDKWFWLKIFFVIMVVLSAADLMSYAFSEPGLFNLVVIKTTLLIFVPMIFLIALKGSYHKKKLEKTKKNAKIFEEKREKEIREIVAEDPDFNTFCFRCVHFDQESLGCSKDRVFEKVKEINIGKRTYCLYWEEVKNPGSPESFVIR